MFGLGSHSLRIDHIGEILFYVTQRRSTVYVCDLWPASAIQAFNVQQIDTIIRPSVSVVGDHSECRRQWCNQACGKGPLPLNDSTQLSVQLEDINAHAKGWHGWRTPSAKETIVSSVTIPRVLFPFSSYFECGTSLLACHLFRLDK